MSSSSSSSSRDGGAESSSSSDLMTRKPMTSASVARLQPGPHAEPNASERMFSASLPAPLVVVSATEPPAEPASATPAPVTAVLTPTVPVASAESVSDRGAVPDAPAEHVRSQSTVSAMGTAHTSSIDLAGAADGTVIVHVVTVDGDRKALRVASDSLVSAIKDDFARRISVLQPQFFELAVPGPDCDLFLDPSASLGSVALQADRTMLFKVRYWKEPKSLTDPVTIRKIYAQIQRNIVTGIWDAPEAVAMRLASYHVRSTFGEFATRARTMAFLGDVNLREVLPPWMVDALPAAYYRSRLTRMHEKLVGQFGEDAEAAKRFIEVARQLPAFGLTVFSVKDERGVAVRVSVAEDGVFITPPLAVGASESVSELSLDRFTPYSQLREWAIDPSGLGFRLVAARSGGTRAYTEDEIVSDRVSTRFIATAAQSEAVLALITDYVRIAVAMSERTDEARAARLERLTFDARRGHTLPSLDAFLPFARRKQQTFRFRSRLEALKHFLVVRFRQASLAPVAKLWLDVDSALDSNRWLDSLDLSATGTDSVALRAITTALVDAFSLGVGPGAEAATALIEDFPLTSMLLADNGIAAPAMPFLDADLRTVLALHPRIRAIDLSYNVGISNKGAQAMQESLTAAAFLATVSFGHCDIGNKGALSIFTAFSGSHSLQTLLMHGNRITDEKEWSSACRDMLTACMTLTHLDLSSNKIGDAALDNIVTGLMMSQSLRRLALGDNKFTPKAFKKLATYLHANRGIQSLSVGENKASNDVGEDIGRGVELSHSLVELDIGGLGLGRPGLGNLFTVLQAKTCHLLTLRLDGAILDARGVEDVATVIEHNRSLISLSLRDAKLGGRLVIANALGANRTLVSLDLGANGLKSTDVQSLADGLARNATLKVLTLDSNAYSNHGLEILSQALQANRGLVSVNMDRSKVGDKGLVLLPSALSSNSFLRVLSLRDNAITVKGFERVLDALRGNASLRQLHLEGNSLKETAGLADRVSAEGIVCSIYI